MFTGADKENPRCLQYFFSLYWKTDQLKLFVSAWQYAGNESTGDQSHIIRPIDVPRQQSVSPSVCCYLIVAVENLIMWADNREIELEMRDRMPVARIRSPLDDSSKKSP